MSCNRCLHLFEAFFWQKKFKGGQKISRLPPPPMKFKFFFSWHQKQFQNFFWRCHSTNWLPALPYWRGLSSSLSLFLSSCQVPPLHTLTHSHTQMHAPSLSLSRTRTHFPSFFPKTLLEHHLVTFLYHTDLSMMLFQSSFQNILFWNTTYLMGAISAR